MTTTTALESHPFLAGFRPEDVQKIAALAEEVSFAKDEVIFNEGDSRGLFYLVIDGLVALEICGPLGCITIQTVRGGEELGWSAMVPSRKFYKARVIEPVQAFAIPGRKLIDACEEDHEFGYRVMHELVGVISDRLRSASIQLLDLYRPRKGAKG
jgi:CRP-like cAMP-binding protein